jgi:hypothetical protein
MMIHYNDEAKLEQALEYLKGAYRLAPKRPVPPPLIVERVASSRRSGSSDSEKSEAPFDSGLRCIHTHRST